MVSSHFILAPIITSESVIFFRLIFFFLIQLHQILIEARGISVASGGISVAELWALQLSQVGSGVVRHMGLVAPHVES